MFIFGGEREKKHVAYLFCSADSAHLYTTTINTGYKPHPKLRLRLWEFSDWSTAVVLQSSAPVCDPKNIFSRICRS